MINVAIVGTGGISNEHIKGLLTFPERCSIVALCDIYPQKAEGGGKGQLRTGQHGVCRS